MRSFNIGSLALITNFVGHPNITLQTPISGLDSPLIRMSSNPKPGDNGSVVSSMFYDNRLVGLTGEIWANNPTDFEAARRALANAVLITKDSNGYPVPTRITFTTLAGTNYYVDVYFDRPIMDYDKPNVSKFTVIGTCVNPFLFGASGYSSGNMTVGTAGGYLSPYISPYITGSTTGGTGTINNLGNVDAPPVLTLVGPLTSPYIYSTATGKFMQINYTINAGDTVKIDMGAKTIILNNSSSLNSYKATGADWFNVLPGLNSFNFSTSSSSDTGFALITGNPAFTNA